MEGLIQELVKDYIDNPAGILSDARWEIYEVFCTVPESEMYSEVISGFFNQFIAPGDTTEDQRTEFIRNDLSVILHKYMNLIGINP